jgi:pyruvate dehydrogenase E1 component alpha subunit
VSKSSTSTAEPKAAKPADRPLAPVNAKLSAEEKIGLYRLMVRIRRFEERSIRAYQQGKIFGFCHTYDGQEAVAVGTISVATKDDPIITAYRDHAHGLAAGMGMNEIMAEMYGRYTGCSKGKGGSMHIFDVARNFWGGHGIVGGQTPMGLGLAFGVKYSGKQGACLCYLGDGATNQGAFAESLNLAALWKIPVVYIIENNFYSMGTSVPRSSAATPLAKRAEGYGMEWDVVNGNDLYEVREKTDRALRRARESCEPTLLEIQTYRYRGHSMSDPGTYRTKEEVQEKRKTDPLALFASILKEEGVLDDATMESIDEAAKAEAEESARFADESPWPPAEELGTDIYLD